MTAVAALAAGTAFA